ncbi:MAG: methyltransferase domain-containing protein [Methylophaga sp.]|nr:methyltransferase domain-containing protein [Methylophaga sp.]
MGGLQEKWDNIYQDKPEEPTASFVLSQYSYLLITEGIALDLACGQGGNALFLAQSGLEVQAWDTSPVAIEQLKKQAKLKKLDIDARVRDVITSPPLPESIDVLVVSFFLDRELCSQLYSALKPGGILFYQTYCQQKTSKQGPKNPDYLLADNELLQLFSQMKVRIYQQDAFLGDAKQGLRNQAILVAEKI